MLSHSATTGVVTVRWHLLRPIAGAVAVSAEAWTLAEAVVRAENAVLAVLPAAGLVVTVVVSAETMVLVALRAAGHVVQG